MTKCLINVLPLLSRHKKQWISCLILLREDTSRICLFEYIFNIVEIVMEDILVLCVVDIVMVIKLLCAILSLSIGKKTTVFVISSNSL